MTTSLRDHDVVFLTDPSLRRAPGGCFTLLEPLLVFYRPTGIRYAVPAGFTTDGCSIPRVFWFFVGQPYADGFLRAAIWHDCMCQEGRAHRSTIASADVHQRFYHALRADGVGWMRARVMYAAVALFGPCWTVLPKVRA